MMDNIIWVGIIADIGPKTSDTKIVVSNCYNVGTLEYQGKEVRVGGICGFTSRVTKQNLSITNSYNAGGHSGTGVWHIGAIIGTHGYGASNVAETVQNCYGINNMTYLYQGDSNSTEGIVPEDTLRTYAERLGDKFMPDEKNEDETWKYNNGYPILKWELDFIH